MARSEISGRQIGREAFTIDEFCFSHGISRATFYNLQKDGEAPDTIRARGRVLITAAAATRWRKQRAVRRPETHLASIAKPEERKPPVHDGLEALHTTAKRRRETLQARIAGTRS